ncbi:MAG: hypothetical protein ACOC11_00030 [Prolixibacteraceae bacterium]
MKGFSDFARKYEMFFPIVEDISRFWTNMLVEIMLFSQIIIF